uniref:Uncharacterized protein LOC104233358 n=1 Tax=Nicotiana sylvestris TaxID=4096 RepID=A0A1U7XF17_NICSY|nr:PREDICTED: uncharacterized protein LOC104233358 [Nicotiana sylvestris]
MSECPNRRTIILMEEAYEREESRESCEEEEVECDDQVEYNTPNLSLYVIRRVLSAQVMEDMNQRENLFHGRYPLKKNSSGSLQERTPSEVTEATLAQNEDSSILQGGKIESLEVHQVDNDSSCFDGLNDLFAYEEVLIEVEENVKVASLCELSGKVSSFKPFDSFLFDCEMESFEFDLDLPIKGSIFEKSFEITNEIVLEAKLFEKEERNCNKQFFSRMVTDQQEIADVFVEYYQVLLGTKGGNRIAAFQSFMKNGHTLTTSQQLKLVRQYTAAEVKKQYLALRKLRVQVISKRLKEALYALVADNQAAFIEGRSLLHNVLIYHDLLRYYNRKTTPRCLVKIDLKKAYDMVSWDFSEEILRCYGFLIPFIKLIMVGVTSTSFTIKVNGEGYGYFKGKRGLRQGDRMSLLFVLVMEYLSRVLRQMGDLPDFQYHPMYKSTKLTHLIFADDLILFVKGTIKSIYRMMEAINHFSGQPGQITHIFSSDRRGFEKGNLGYYWIFSWLITYEVINAVLFSVYNFWGAVFILLQTVSKAIDRKCRDYLWGSTEEHRKMSLVAWKKVRQPKKFGGLNIKGCKQWNVASIGKLLWQLTCRDIWAHKPPMDYSWYWKKLNELNEKLAQWYTGNIYNLASSGVYSISCSYIAMADLSTRLREAELI